jgi:hypothetical protein
VGRFRGRAAARARQRPLAVEHSAAPLAAPRVRPWSKPLIQTVLVKTVLVASIWPEHLAAPRPRGTRVASAP